MSSKILKPIIGVVEIAAGILTANPMLIAAGAMTEISAAADLLAPKAKPTASTQNRLNANLITTAPRAIVFGTTAAATEVRYQAYSGSNQEYLEQIVACASHQLQSIDEIWFDNEKAWTKAGGVQGRYAGYLTVTDRPVGTRTNGIAIDATWTANATLTGCAYVYLRYKLTGNSSKATSPFSGGVPSRMTIRCHAMPVYDPRFDSTVTGGSGTQRANDQTTWAFSTGGVESGRNPALQTLAWLLGWRIQNPSTAAWKLAVGRGVPPVRIDLPSFITAANVCDEAVALAAGGTEPRYRSDGIFSEADDGKQVRDVLCAAMNGWLDDSGGKLSLGITKNDLATPFLALSEKDIIGNEALAAAPSIEQIPNIVRGRYVDASDNGLYQLVDAPEVSLASSDGIDRIDSFDQGNVQSASQKQRIAKQRLQRAQYPLRYSATFGARAWQLSRGKIVTFSHPGLGWSNKLFRVAAISLAMSGTATATLEEENAILYSWSASELAPVTAAAPTVYDPLNSPLVAGIAESVRVTYRQTTDPRGSYTIRDFDQWIDTSSSPMVLKVSMSGFWQFGANYVSQGSDIGVSNAATRTWPASGTAPASPSTGDEWPDTSTSPTTLKRWSGFTWTVIANLVTQGTDIGVDNGATKNSAERALNPNSSFQDGLVAYTNPYSGTPAYGASANSTRGGNVAILASGVGLRTQQIAVTPNETIYFAYRFVTTVNRTGGGAPTWYMGLEGGPAVGTAPTTDLGPISGTAIAVSAGAQSAVFGPYTVPAATYAICARTVFDLGNLGGGGVGQVDYMELYRDEPGVDNGLASKYGTLPKTGNLPNNAVFGAGYYYSGAITYSASAGTPATATISVAAGTLTGGSFSLAYSAMSVNVSGTGGTSAIYGLYVNDASRAGGTQTLVATTSGSTLAGGDGYVQIGSCTVVFPASGTGGGGGTRGGGSGIQP